MLSPSTDLARWSRGAFLVALLMVLVGLRPALAQDTAQKNAAKANGESAAGESAQAVEAEAPDGAASATETPAEAPVM